MSMQTVSRRLAEAGLSANRPLRRLPSHRRQHMHWCRRARATWHDGSHSVVFTLSLAQRRRGNWANPSTILGRNTACQRGVMAWAAISINKWSPLVWINRTLTARRYVNEVIQPVALPYVQGIPTDILQKDNAQSHPHIQRTSAGMFCKVFTWCLGQHDYEFSL